MPMMPNQSNPFMMGPGGGAMPPGQPGQMPMQPGQTPPIMAPGQMPPQPMPPQQPGQGGFFNSIFNPNAGSPSAFTSPGMNPQMLSQLMQMQGGQQMPPQPPGPGGDLMSMLQRFRNGQQGQGQFGDHQQGMDQQRQQMIQQLMQRMGGGMGQQPHPFGPNFGQQNPGSPNPMFSMTGAA